MPPKDKKIDLQGTVEYRNLIKEITFLRKQEEETGEKIAGTQKVWLDNAEKIVKEYADMGEVTGEVADTSKDILKLVTKLLDPTTKNRKELEKTLGVKGKIAGLDEDIQDSIDKQVKSAANLNDQWSEFVKQQKDASGATNNLFNTLDDAIGGFGGKILKFLFNPITAIFAILGGGVALFKSYSNQVDLIGKSFGATTLQADSLKQTVFDINAEGAKLDILMKDLAGPIQTITEQFGMAQGEAVRLAFESSKMAMALGISVDDSIQLVGQFKKLVGLSLEQSEYQAKAFAMIAKQRNVAPQAIMRDIAKSGEFFAKYSNEAGTNILDAAIAANQLGINLGVVEQIQSNVLDFSSSIEKEFLASTILGKKINFNEARRAFLAKDTVGAMSAIRKELDNIDLGALDPISMDIVAKAFGTTAKDLKTMATQSKDLAKFSETTNDQIQDQSNAVNDMTADKALSELTKMQNTTKNMAHILNQQMIPSFEKMDKVVNNITNGIEKFLKMMSGLPTIIGGAIAAMAMLYMWTRRTQMASMGMGRGMGGGAAMMGGFGGGVGFGTAATGVSGNMMSFAGGGLGSRAIQKGNLRYDAKMGRWRDYGPNAKVKGQFANTPRGGSLLTSSSRGMKALRGGMRFAKGSGWLAVAGLGMDFMSNYQQSGDLADALYKTAKGNAGMLTGAATGAAIGSIIPGLGTAAGALIGAGLGGVVDMFRGGIITKDGKAYGYNDEDDVYLAMTSRMGIGPESSLKQQNDRLQQQVFSMMGQGGGTAVAGSTNVAFAPVEVKIKRDELNYILAPGRA